MEISYLSPVCVLIVSVKKRFEIQDSVYKKYLLEKFPETMRNHSVLHIMSSVYLSLRGDNLTLLC